MRLKQSKLVFIILIPIFISCFEKDKRVLPYPGEVSTIHDNIEQYESYFDFETGKVIKTHPADAWQLGFECGENGWHILVNSGHLANLQHRTNQNRQYYERSFKRRVEIRYTIGLS